jgi:hypothetical protein
MNSVVAQHERSSPYSQQPDTCPYLEPTESTLHPLVNLSNKNIISNHILPYTKRSSELSPSGFPTKTLHNFLLSPIRIIYPAHLVLHYFICLMIFGDEYKLWSFSLCRFLHSLVTSSRLGSIFFLETQETPGKTSNRLVNKILSLFETGIPNSLNCWTWHNVTETDSHILREYKDFAELRCRSSCKLLIEPNDCTIPWCKVLYSMGGSRLLLQYKKWRCTTDKKW